MVNYNLITGCGSAWLERLVRDQEVPGSNPGTPTINHLGEIMRYGIFSDVHSNLEALEAVLEAFKNESIEKYLCVGDIVGYGADPIECIRILRQLNPVMVCGNHDWATVDLFDKKWFNQYAEKAVTWTQSVLSDEDKDFLKSLELTKQIDGLGLVHGTLDNPAMFKYVFDLFEAEVCLEESLDHICFIGHTHRPVIFFMKGQEVNYILDNQVYIQDGTRYLINVGSVGQPRDGNPYACYCVYDSVTRLFQIKRIAYDVHKAQEKILNAGLPHMFADRLPQGR